MRPLTKLPRSWRMTEREELTFDAILGITSRRLKVRRNLMSFGTGENTDEIDALIRSLDELRSDPAGTRR